MKYRAMPISRADGNFWAIQYEVPKPTGLRIFTDRHGEMMWRHHHSVGTLEEAREAVKHMRQDPVEI